MIDRKALEKIVMASFFGELEAFKPGNVSFYANGHNMTVDDFQKSAEASVPILCEINSSLGQRILNSVCATKEVVGCNTNLGMLLLFAPLIMAAEAGFRDRSELQKNLENTLSSIVKTDAEQIFEAIVIASPGGLNRVNEHDVNKAPDCTLYEAMDSARNRDSIALQYVNNFNEIFNIGLVEIKNFDKRWNSVKWATVSCYLNFMSLLLDSHLARKFGKEVAEDIRIKSKVIAKNFNSSSVPESSIEILQSYDLELKEKNYNPGTNADLTAASLLVYNLIS
ncbi:MAG: triphosphoribosyl-dephospho-CoA synthase [Legionellales bacterium]|nr:triphosphoribosyl-dephospho-CoA synthase [Legionellales bacterium]|tara:strand:- start:375 stop:1217 length:843 start_codon:yes stop_codon:yes gene_type:complete